jgi:hypothetical protein
VSTENEPSEATLVVTKPGEHIAYARTVAEVTSAETSSLSPEADREIVIAVSGTGFVCWHGVDHRVSTKEPVTVSGGVQYTLRSDSSEELTVMIYGIEEQH